jgi:hypothetical protein
LQLVTTIFKKLLEWMVAASEHRIAPIPLARDLFARDQPARLVRECIMFSQNIFEMIVSTQMQILNCTSCLNALNIVGDNQWYLCFSPRQIYVTSSQGVNVVR